MFRKASIDDCMTVYQLICDMEAETLHYFRFQEIFKKQLNDDTRYECIVCEENETVIGILNLRYEEQLHHAENIAEVMEFVVASEYRNKGIGRKMFAYACEQAIKNGCIQIEVASNLLRRDAHRFYLREGMENLHYKFSKRLDLVNKL